MLQGGMHRTLHLQFGILYMIPGHRHLADHRSCQWEPMLKCVAKQQHGALQRTSTQPTTQRRPSHDAGCTCNTPLSLPASAPHLQQTWGPA